MFGAAIRGVLKGDVKELVVAVSVEGAALQHRPEPPEQRWYRQLLDLLCVEDDPILGYRPPTPLTQLHLHLCRCAADYRPPPLPLRVLVSAETISVSSNVVSDTAVFVLRLLVDDAALFLTERCDGVGLQLHSDFVCVVEVDFMELQISAWKGSDGRAVSGADVGRMWGG
ncbi:autophagy-related protein 2 homolog A-like, partial [Gallus gallus]|uniref:autophagy-related protein 2 homolog A-like n=1 Tax=Gallus gallus TaxID=9031 RepID=UPI001AE13A74